MEYALLAVLIVGFAGLGFLLLRKNSPAASESDIARRKGELEGQNKQMFAQLADLKAQLGSAQRERDQLQKQLAKHEEAVERKEQDFALKVQNLNKAEQALKEERARVIREEEERQKKALEERDRLWANHEISVVAALTDLCKLPTLSFTSFTNTNLPDGFDGTLKPDFMIEFLGQYIVFDAKVSRAKNGIRGYIDDQVKKTVEKVKHNTLIHPWIFLVVPASSLAELKQHHYVVEGYHLYVVCIETLPAVLNSLKHITRYEFAEQLDPQKRENLIQLVAEMDFHISTRNATEIFLAQSGINVLEKAKKIDPEIWAEAQVKKQDMKVPTFNELKKLVNDAAAQEEAIQSLISPKVAIKKKDLERAKQSIVEQLF
jgi:hypothetical protein